MAKRAFRRPEEVGEDELEVLLYALNGLLQAEKRGLLIPRSYVRDDEAQLLMIDGDPHAPSVRVVDRRVKSTRPSPLVPSAALPVDIEASAELDDFFGSFLRAQGVSPSAEAEDHFEVDTSVVPAPDDLAAWKAVDLALIGRLVDAVATSRQLEKERPYRRFFGERAVGEELLADSVDIGPRAAGSSPGKFARRRIGLIDDRAATCGGESYQRSAISRQQEDGSCAVRVTLRPTPIRISTRA